MMDGLPCAKLINHEKDVIDRKEDRQPRNDHKVPKSTPGVYVNFGTAHWLTYSVPVLV